MAFEQKLTIKLGQKLVMTPSLQQAIKLLQMSKLELVEEVQQELLENPVLEENTENRDERSDAENKDEDGDPFDQIDVEAFFADMEYTPTTPSSREVGPELPTFEATLSEPTDLAEHLTSQLDLSTSDPRIQAIGRAIIGNLDENGYIKASMEEIQQLGSYSEAEVDSVIRMIQVFDPIGVAARDLRECLLIQLRHLGLEGTITDTLVREHIDKLQDTRQYKKLSDALGIEMEDLQAELEFIRSRLDPHPGRRYNVDRSTYVVPDVYVVKVGDEYQIVLNDEGLPRLHISPTYRRMARASKEDASGETREYVQRKLRSALRLIKSLEERQRTIYKVAESIVRFQRGFLDRGIDQLRPLVLKDVADDIGMHESTVSRVVNNKYMHTHRGMFEMRFFFHSGIGSSRGGPEISSLTVKEKIRRLIKDEDSNKPLSDSAIEKRLKAEGLQIARRTVAKYREELNIPSSSNRKQVFT